MAALSDCYWLWEIPELKKNINKAERILEEGLSVPGITDRSFLEERVSELKKKKAVWTATPKTIAFREM